MLQPVARVRLVSVRRCAYCAQVEETQQPLRPYDPMDTLKQFLDHDRHVLRFYCYWDDRDETFGDVRYMTLHYYLADDTIEVGPPCRAATARHCVKQERPRDFG